MRSRSNNNNSNLDRGSNEIDQRSNGSGATNNHNNDSPVMVLHTSLFDFGQERALVSGALKPQQADVQALRDHADAMACETWREIFNPDKNPEHALRDAEHKKALADRGDAEDAVHFAAADVREKEQALARNSSSEKPTAHLLISVLTIGVGITMLPTLRDFLFANLEDEIMGWFWSMLSAICLASVLIWAILGSLSATGRRTAANWVGLAAGITVSLGLGLFRLSGAMGLEEVIMALGLTLVELGLVVMAEWLAAGLRPRYVEWTENQSAYNQATAELEAARAEQERRENRLAQLNEKISSHINYVEDLSLRNINLQHLIEISVRAVLDGYNKGLALNKGRVIRTGARQ